MSLRNRNFTMGLYRCFKASSRFFMNWLKFPVGLLYKLNIINLDDLVSSSTAQNSKTLSLQLCGKLILLKYEQIYTHLRSVDFDGRNLIPIYNLAMWDVAGPIPPCDA